VRIAAFTALQSLLFWPSGGQPNVYLWHRCGVGEVNLQAFIVIVNSNILLFFYGSGRRRDEVWGCMIKKNTKEGMGMDYEEAAQLRYQEMCRIVGDVVFAMVAEGHETKRVAIADVIRTEISKGIDKWDLDQIQVMKLAVKLLEE
jgi:hypothetical protein